MYLWGQRSASNLGNLGYRPNQAVQRIYSRGMGDDITVGVDPTLLYAGLGVLALAAILFTGKKAARSVKRYRSRGLKRKRARLQQKIDALGNL